MTFILEAVRGPELRRRACHWTWSIMGEASNSCEVRAGEWPWVIPGSVSDLIMGGKRLPPPPAASSDPMCTMEILLFQLLYCLEWGRTVQGCGRLVEKGQRAGSQPGGSSHTCEVCPLQPLLPLRTPAGEVAVHISLGTPPAPNLQLQNTGAFCGGPS